MAILRRAILGKQYGNFRIDQFSSRDPNDRVSGKERFLSFVREKILDPFKLRLIFTTRFMQGNKVVALTREDSRWADWFVMSNGFADGGIIEGGKQAVVYFTGDCPIVALYDDQGRLAVLHAGFRPLIPANADHRSIIRVTFKDHGFDSKKTQAFAGFGIGPCCYGAEHFLEVRDGDPFYRRFVRRAYRGPREGQRSFDLCSFIRNELLELGVPEPHIEIDYECTACSGRFHSHVREGLRAGRNAAFAWLE